MLNNGTLTESRTWLLVRTWHCYFISFNSEHPVYQYHCFRHEDEYDIAKFLCLVNIFYWTW